MAKLPGATIQASVYGITDSVFNDHMRLETVKDNKQVKLNARDFSQTSGDSIAFIAQPNQIATTTGEVFGGQIKPRLASGLSAATVNGLGIDSELKGTGATTVTSDLRGLNLYMGAASANHVIGGDVVVFRSRAEISTNPTGHIVLHKVVNHEGSQGWDGFVKFAEALGTHSMTTNSDKTGNAKSGTIKVIANNTLYHIQLFAD